MKIISLVNQKGGAGKTTLAISLAVAFSKAGENVVLLDLDPQASAAEWHDVRTDKFPHVESIQPSRLKKTVEQLTDIGTDILILDTAPHSESTALDAMSISDLVLIPCQPSIMDIRSMAKTASLIKLNPGKPTFVVMNAVPHHSMSAARQASRTIETHLGLPICPVMVGQRVAYSRCLIDGLSAEEYEPEGKAADEIAALLRWTRKTLKARLAA